MLAAALLVAWPFLSLRAQESPASTSYTLRGTVVDAVSGQPLARAFVELDQDAAVLTDNDGHFSFDNVPPSQSMGSVSVRKPGYWSIGQSSMGGMHAGFPLPQLPPRPIRMDPDVPPLIIQLTPLASIAGTVTLSTSDPADGIQIMAYTQRVQNGHRLWTMAGSAQTRSDGSFRLAGLAPGSYLLHAQPTVNRPGLQNAPVWGFPALYYPGVTDPAAAGRIVLKAGQHAQADITLVRQQFFPVTALVRSSNPDQPGNFQILDSGGHATGVFANYNQLDQTVTANVPNGSWSLEAHSYGRDMLWGRTDFHVAGAPASLAISLLPIPHIPLNIRRDFTVSGSESQNQSQSSGPVMSLFLTSADDFSLTPYGGGVNSVEGSNGQQWEVRLQEPGRYWVQATPFPPAYISSITSGGVDLAASPLIIVPGTDPAPIDITLRNDGGTITGQLTGLAGPAPTPQGGIVSGMFQPEAWVYAIPLFPTTANAASGFVQQGGHFTIGDLAPGSYRVVASDTPQEIDSHSPESLAAWAGKGQTVTVDAGATASVQLSLVSTEASQ